MTTERNIPANNIPTLRQLYSRIADTATTKSQLARHLAAIALMIMAVAPGLRQNAAHAQGQRAEVLMETTEGNIRVELFDETPIHRDNFLKLVDEHFYDSLLFHRVISDFMIQSGDPDSKNARPGQELGEASPDYTLPAEFRLPKIYHRRGALAMARESDDENPERRSSSSQFYIVWGQRFSTAEINKMQDWLDSTSNGTIKLTPEMIATYRMTGGSPHLDGTYTVFGEVTEGLEVVEKIQKADTDYNDRPVYDVRILKATVTRRKQ